MKRILSLALLINFICPPVQAELGTYSVVKEKGFVKFIAIQNNVPLEGKFTEYSANIQFDYDTPEKTAIAAEVDVGSITTNNDDVTKNIKLPEWLSAESFPKAYFKSTKIVRMPSSDNYHGEGELTIRGKTAPVVINFILEKFDGTNAVAKGFITVRRNDFEIGQGEWQKTDVIKNEVRIEFRIFATKQ